MKQILCLSLLVSIPFTTAFSASTKTHQLPAQNIDVAPAHLTTRLNWSIFPKPIYANEDLKQRDRAAIIRVAANAKGKITDASVEESTGVDALDRILIQAVKKAEVKPHTENGEAKAIIGYQAFNLRVKGNTPECDFNFDSKVWNAQNADKKTTFKYAAQPNLDINSSELKQHDRKVKFNFKVDKHGQVKKVKIKQGSGIYAIDQKVVQALRNSQISVKRTASTLWVYKKSNFKDEIQFRLNSCK
ncbi:TonB family protein [Acinetobacter gandensis]|uniref:TonB-dependent receptor n=1 Tax=Acinetobacter gandensis TaxID=1443941 RepID=A0A1A7R9P4_9GAMM|nr:energy transducer TonB [Acinetobacter gandensis]KAB0623786.1 TonB family protein [Acinetobacter gandensis]OBX28631.1 TonB-dependent receptor [Acinetobacter gandensis]